MNDYEKSKFAEYEVALIKASAFLDELANRLDGWARESRGGGWSTHQVQSNINAANDCRRLSAEIKLVAR